MTVWTWTHHYSSSDKDLEITCSAKKNDQVYHTTYGSWSFFQYYSEGKLYVKANNNNDTQAKAFTAGHLTDQRTALKFYGENCPSNETLSAHHSTTAQDDTGSLPSLAPLPVKKKKKKKEKEKEKKKEKKKKEQDTDITCYMHSLPIWNQQQQDKQIQLQKKEVLPLRGK